MKIKRGVVGIFLLIVCSVTWMEAKEMINDPYQILKNHFDAVGGLEKLKEKNKIYAEGNLRILDANLNGTTKIWAEKPLKMKQEVNLGIVEMISGDNGEFSWSVDANGKILVHRDDETLKEREVRRLMEDYEYFDPQSENFILSCEGTETVNGEECFVLTIRNRIDETERRYYYSTKTFYLVKEVYVGLDREERTLYSDHRSIDGVIVAFREDREMVPLGQRQQIEYTRYEFLSKVDPDIFEPPQDDVVDYTFTNGESAEEIRCEFIENHIYLPVIIKGKERLWVLDSGASVTVIDSGYAAEMGLPFKGPIKAKAMTGVVDLYHVTIPAFSLEGVVFEEQQVMAMNVRKLFKKILGLDVAGILGYDFLSRFVTKIDYANEKISFYTPESFKYNGGGKVIEAFLDEARMFSIPITVDNKYSGKWRLDIGASGEDLHYPFASEYNLLDREGIDAVSFGAAGSQKTKRSQFESISIDGFTIKNPLIDIAYQDDPGSVGDRSHIGNVGNTFLRHFVLFLDYDKQQIILEKGNDYEREFPHSKAGLQLWYGESGNIEVFHVSPHTPAEESGFKKGDIINAVNGIDIAYFDGIISLRKLMREEEGEAYSFTISRDGEILEIPLTLRELY
jgi:hypothetical protein